jgi:hypothetical protein
MPTWAEIKEYAVSKYTLNHNEERYFSLTWEYDGGRSQMIWVRNYQSMDRDWIEFRTFVCHGGDMDPLLALQKNAEFTIGALAVDGDGDYMMIHNAPLAGLDPDEFELPLMVLSRTADQLEQEHSAKDDF